MEEVWTWIPHRETVGLDGSFRALYIHTPLVENAIKDKMCTAINQPFDIRQYLWTLFQPCLWSLQMSGGWVSSSVKLAQGQCPECSEARPLDRLFLHTLDSGACLVSDWKHLSLGWSSGQRTGLWRIQFSRNGYSVPGCRHPLNRVWVDTVLTMPGGDYTGESQALLNKTTVKPNLGLSTNCTHLYTSVGKLILGSLCWNSVEVLIAPHLQEYPVGQLIKTEQTADEEWLFFFPGRDLNLWKVHKCSPITQVNLQSLPWSTARNLWTWRSWKSLSKVNKL